jgi:hypothetical protein
MAATVSKAVGGRNVGTPYNFSKLVISDCDTVHLFRSQFAKVIVATEDASQTQCPVLSGLLD